MLESNAVRGRDPSVISGLRLPLLVAALVTSPAMAQTLPIAPTASVLFGAQSSAAGFRHRVAADSTFRQDARTVGTGLGIIAGSAVVYALSQVSRSGGCDTGVGTGGCQSQWHPGVGGYLLGATIGDVAGYLIGSALDHSEVRR